MCEKYSELIYITIKNPILVADENTYIKFKDCHDVLPLIVNETLANPNEFPHILLLLLFITKTPNPMHGFAADH